MNKTGALRLNATGVVDDTFYNVQITEKQPLSLNTKGRSSWIKDIFYVHEICYIVLLGMDETYPKINSLEFWPPIYH